MVIRIFTLCAILLSGSIFAVHDKLLIERVDANFADTWAALSETVAAYHYQEAYLQRCDFALKERHYKSDKYRILFFGQYDEIKKMSKKYPKITPFLPLKVTVMEEGGHTLMIATPPITLSSLVKTHDDRMIIFRWQEEMKSILKQVKDQF
jgi:uncharacterized protein (DUF302 family)